jgi:hypothetical protein
MIRNPCLLMITNETINRMADMSSVTVSSPAAHSNTLGYTVLYYGSYSSAILKIFDEQGKVIDNRIDELQITRPGDFNWL